jgi:rhodanese-related sulfurtransferase
MTIRHVSAADARAMLAQGAVLVDIREADEWRQSHIPGAVLYPLSQIARPTAHYGTGDPFLPQRRPNRHAETVPGAEVLLPDGGIEA